MDMTNRNETNKAQFNKLKGKSDTKGNLSIIFFNAQSLLSKIDELSEFLDNSDPDIVGVVETWFDDSHKPAEFKITNYNTEYKNRHKEPNRGGILFYIHKRVEYSLLDVPAHIPGCRCENLWVRIHNKGGNGSDAIFGIIYRSHLNPSPTFIKHLDEELEYITSFNLPTYIMGDFNYDLISKTANRNREVNNYISTMESHLFDQHISKPTRITDKSATLLDHFWSNNEGRLIECNVKPGFSDHSSITAKIDLKISHNKGRPFLCRSYKRMDINGYIQNLRNIDWSFLDGDGDIEYIWDTFKFNIKDVIEKHTKMITIKDNKSCSKPWINGHVKNLIRLKQAAELRKDYIPTTENMKKFKTAKNLQTSSMFIAKQNFYHNKVEENTTNPRKLWAIMRETSPSNLKTKGENKTTISADAFAEYFTTIGNFEKDSTTTNTPIKETTKCENSFEISPCTENEILKIVKNLPANKADGIDGIPIKCIKMGISALAHPITKLVNNLIAKGFPNELKRAIVLPIHKKGKTDNPSNFRPISILPGISKIAERVIANKLNKFLQDNSLLSDTQHGFRQDHSTNTALLHITEGIRRELDVGKSIGLVALDLSKAFDTLDHQILLNKLKTYNIGCSTLSFFNNYLINRTMIVKTNNNSSQIYKLDKGVPQGSILGPLLFTLYVNDLPTVVKNSQVMQYADDTTLYVSSKYPGNIQSYLNQDLEHLEEWFRRNKMRLNTDKTDYVLITNNQRRRVFDTIKISLGGKQIEEKENVKILGVTISKDLTWDMHTSNLINTLKYCFYSFSRSCKYLNYDTRIMLYNAVIASRLNYCDAIWDCCSVNSKHRLQTIQNRCARRILNCVPGTSSAPLLKELGWIRLDKKRKLHKCVYLHRLLQGKGPQPILDMLKPFANNTRIMTRGVNNQNLFIPRHHTNYVKKSYFNDTAVLWNSIPKEIKAAKSNKTFKERLYLHLLEASPQ